MERRTRREQILSAALSITDDLLHRNILLLRAKALNRYAIACCPTGSALSPEARSRVAGEALCLEDRGVYQPHSRQELPMTTKAITPLRQRMIEDTNARKLCAGTQRGHIRSCKRFAAFLKRSPDTATLEDIRGFQLHLADTGVTICTRN